jgi:hypothetical protein
MDRPDDDAEPGGANEHVFTMDPEATLRAVAHQFVAGQHVIATLSRTASTLRAAASPTPETARMLAEFDATLHQWHTEALPGLAASMKSAAEVYDTFGPGITTVDDPTDAAIWNNKWFAWEWELSGRPAR